MPVLNNQNAGDNEGNQSDNTGVTQLLQTLILEVRSMRLAIVSIAVGERNVNAQDFDPQSCSTNDDDNNDPTI